MSVCLYCYVLVAALQVCVYRFNTCIHIHMNAICVMYNDFLFADSSSVWLVALLYLVPTILELTVMMIQRIQGNNCGLLKTTVHSMTLLVLDAGLE